MNFLNKLFAFNSKEEIESAVPHDLLKLLTKGLSKRDKKTSASSIKAVFEDITNENGEIESLPSSISYCLNKITRCLFVGVFFLKDIKTILKRLKKNLQIIDINAEIEINELPKEYLVRYSFTTNEDKRKFAKLLKLY